MSLSFEEAVHQTLAMAGVGVLADPKRLLSYVMDLCDPGSPELGVLIRNCDEELLDPYRRAADESLEESLETATTRALFVLVDKRAIDATKASALCGGIERALRRHLEELPEEEPPQPAPAPEPEPGLEAGGVTSESPVSLQVEQEVVDAVTQQAPDAELRAGEEPEPTLMDEPGPVPPEDSDDPVGPDPEGPHANEEVPPSKPKNRIRGWHLLAALVVVLGIAAAVVRMNLSSVSFDGNGATGGKIPKVWHWKGRSVTLPESTFEREGYLFKGWSENEDSTVGEYQPHQDVYLEDRTLYAVWATRDVTFTFSCGYDDGPDPVEVPYERGSRAELPECTFTREGFDFLRWKDSVSGETFDPGDVLDATEPRSFEAQWDSTTYTVTFEGYGVEESGIEDIVADRGESITLPDMLAERKWYRFEGWWEGLAPVYTYEGETRKAYQPGESMRSSYDLDLHAGWVLDPDQCLEVTREFLATSQPSGKLARGVFVKNVSDVPLDLVAEFEFFDADKVSVGIGKDECRGLAPGQTTFLYDVSEFDGVARTDAETAEYRLSIEEASVEPLWPSIEVKECVANGSEVSITCENVSDHPVTVSWFTLFIEQYEGGGSWAIRPKEVSERPGPGETFVVTVTCEYWDQLPERQFFFYGEGD